MKQCRRCGQEKSLTEFYAQSSKRKDGRKIDGSRGGQGVLALCKPCWREYTYEGNLRRRYGLTPEEYAAMRAAGCTICGASAEERKLNVDHDHRNGKVRAVLCQQCNSMLGMAADAPERLRAGADYLEEWQREHAAA